MPAIDDSWIPSPEDREALTGLARTVRRRERQLPWALGLALLGTLSPLLVVGVPEPRAWASFLSGALLGVSWLLTGTVGRSWLRTHERYWNAASTLGPADVVALGDRARAADLRMREHRDEMGNDDPDLRHTRRLATRELIHECGLLADGLLA